MRELLPEGLGASPGLQCGQHEQVAVREDDLGRGDAARLAQRGEPLGLHGEGIVRGRLAERLDEHRRAVTAAREPRRRGEASSGRLDRDDVGQADRVQALEQERRRGCHGGAPLCWLRIMAISAEPAAAHSPQESIRLGPTRIRGHPSSAATCELSQKKEAKPWILTARPCKAAAVIPGHIRRDRITNH